MKPSGKLMQKHGEEDEYAQPGGDQEACGDGYAVEKGVDRKAEHNRAVRVAVHFLGVRFFAEMKMRGDGVFEQMHEEKTGQDVEQSIRSAEADGLRDHFDECDREHVARAKGEKILQVAARPFAIDHEIAAQQVAACGDQAEDCGEGDAGWKIVGHGEWRSVISFKF